MVKMLFKMILAIPCFVALTGCGLFHRHVSKYSDVRIRNTQQAAIDSADSLAEGQKMLAQGNYGSAISAFHLALIRYPESGMAANGLAIAYDSIGRPDLAERYFEQAMGLEPDNARYRRNFARFTAANDAQATAVAANQAALPALRPYASRQGPALTRVSLAEVRLETDAGQRPQLAYSGSALIELAAGGALHRKRTSNPDQALADLKQAVAMAEQRIKLAQQLAPRAASAVASRAD